MFRIVKHWLKADHDPLYNPVNDYVIIPSAFEMETLKTKGLEVTYLREEWEIIAGDNDQQKNEHLVASIAVAGGDKSEAHANVTVEPQNEGKQHVELNAVSISATA